MSIFSFPSKREREQGPSRLERTATNLAEQISNMQASGQGGIEGFNAKTALLPDGTAEITVLGLTETGNQVGLGSVVLQKICEQLNAYLSTDARPFMVTVEEKPSPIPSSIDDDFVTNRIYSLRVTPQK